MIERRQCRATVAAVNRCAPHGGLRPDLGQVQLLYQSELLDRTVPFWLRHGMDWKNGGICTCLADDGTLISTDKYVWSQLRAVWTFSALYNRIEKRPEYLNAAIHIFDFIKRRGRDARGDWLFCVDAAGQPMLEGATSVYCDAFAIYGFTELARATESNEAVGLACETYERVQRRLGRPGTYQTHPWPIPAGLKAHGVAMMFALAFDELGAHVGDASIKEAALQHAHAVMDVFLQPEQRRLFEFVRADGTLLNEPPGRVVNPGHAIESMWFLIHLYQRVGDHARVRQCVEAIRWHLELGWDELHGGLFLARDAGGSPWEEKWQFKLWWPHTEAMYALLLAYSICGEPWCMEWFQRVHDYAFGHFSVPDHGEWRQNLDREGRQLKGPVALPVKDPFHLARSLILSVTLLKQMTRETAAVPSSA